MRWRPRRSTTAPSAGAPRDPRKREAVLAAARALIVEGGYAAATIQAIAERSGVSRPTIYQRWSDRLSLLEDALFVDRSAAPPPATGTLEGDLRQLIDELVADVRRPEMERALAALHAEAAETRGRQGPYWVATLSRWQAVFDAAATRREIPRAAAAKRARLALRMALGSLFLSALDRSQTSDALATDIHSALCRGLASRRSDHERKRR